MQSTQAIHPKLFVALAHFGGAAIVALALAAFYTLGYAPLLARQQSDELRVIQLTGLLDNSIEIRREHLQLTRKLDDLTQRVERARRSAPASSGEAEFLGELSQIASSEGLVVEDYRRGKVRHLLSHSELEITFKGRGSHSDICRFLRRMEATPRAKQIRRIEIKTSDDAHSYPVEVAFTLFFGMKNNEPKVAQN